MTEHSFTYNGVEIVWLKHAGFKIKGSVIVYIDPYDIPEELEKADLILVTHNHFDHMDVKSIKKISKSDTTVVHPTGCILQGYRTCELSVGDTVNIKGVEIARQAGAMGTEDIIRWVRSQL